MPASERSFEGMRIAIAGAGQGIGAACAWALAQRGARVALCARTAADVVRLAAALRAEGAEAVAIAADLATDEGADRFAAEAFEKLGGLDAGLVCVGAAHPPVALADARRDVLVRQLEQGAVAPVLAAGALLRKWAAQPAPGDDRQLLFLSSLVTRRPPIPGTGPYTAAKAALEALMRGIAEECWPDVRANALCLGPVATRLHEIALSTAAAIAQFPSPEEVAPLVLRLLGSEGRGVTGRAIDADAFQVDGPAALAGDGHLAALAPLQPLGDDGSPGEVPEAEPGRRPSVRVRRAVREAATSLHRYPGLGGRLAARLAALHGVGTDGVALSGGGASELIERALRATCRPGDEVASPFPSFELLSALCSRLGLRHRPVPARRVANGLFGAHEAGPLLAAIGPRTRVVYLASPDNPTGAVLSAAEESRLQSALPRSTLLLIDEAWAGAPQPSPPPGAGAPLLRLRSFSKLHGLAALRVGYAVGSPGAIELLRRLQLPYALGAPQLAAAEAVLDEPERTRRAALLLARRRRWLADGLRHLGLAVSESEGPVLLVRDPSGRPAGRLLFALRATGATVHEAHWDPAAVVIALGGTAEARRLVPAAARALDR